MGVMMGKIVEVNGKEVQLVLQGLDEEDLIKQVDAINEMEHKAKAFDEIVNEFHSQLQNLESWDTLDQKDCQTLKQIVEDNIEEGE